MFMRLTTCLLNNGRDQQSPYLFTGGTASDQLFEMIGADAGGGPDSCSPGASLGVESAAGGAPFEEKLNNTVSADKAGWTELVIQDDHRYGLHVIFAGFFEAPKNTSISTWWGTTVSEVVLPNRTAITVEDSDTFLCADIDQVNSFSCPNNYEVTL